MRYEINKEQNSELIKVNIIDSDFDFLRTICLNEKLNTNAWDSLVWSVIHIRDFELNQKSKIKSKKHELDSLLAVEKAGMALREAIEELPNGDAMRLDSKLCEFEVSSALNSEELFAKIISVQRSACGISAAARKLINNKITEGNDGLGRIKTRPAYASHIAVIAHQLMQHGIPPGGNGPFQRLCDAIFSIARVHTNSQGAIAYFCKNLRPGMKKEGKCL